MTKKILLLACVAMSLLVVGCSKEDNEKENQKQTVSTEEIANGIIGKWKTCTLVHGQWITDNESVTTFGEGGNCTHSESSTDDSDVWEDAIRYTYSVAGDSVVINSEENKAIWKVKELKDNEIKILVRVYQKGQLVSKYEQSGKRITADFSEAIVGLWEGVEMTGEETFGNSDHRIEYKADGSYIYYSRDGDEWKSDKQTVSDYFVDGDLLCTRWTEGSNPKLNKEWWNIESITETEMRWFAIRLKDDGATFRTSFTFRKVAKDEQ